VEDGQQSRHQVRKLYYAATIKSATRAAVHRCSPVFPNVSGTEYSCTVDEERDLHEDEPESFIQDGPGLFDDAPGLLQEPPPALDNEPVTMASTPSRRSPDEPLALYRRYRPQVFSEVIGQEHVTEPLKRALSNNRVNHAYLFSGPRGCGKTSSARILARSLNCEQGPTPDPCGVCQSCRDLARGGPGSIDVIEIDAASHGGVDDARDLRERAFFAPVHSRYKIYIVDEAHMVTAAGFNALLKLVEEPPPHVKFIFATTEPDKVIGTIRSRTHHYPFRLIPPKTMTTFLTTICQEEKVSVEPGVIPLVVRAGGGSVRDSLSVLDQLFAGATDEGVGYAQAAALLGYTPDSLLDSVVDAISADDASGVFAGVDKVIETGQDPRRFAEDLLRRLRDLMIVAAVPDALSSGLLDIPEDQAERFKEQASTIGVGGLTRAAEVLAAGLVAMRGTTAPRLQLELMCARILLPAADAGERGIHQRLERLERMMTGSGAPTNPAATTPETVPVTTQTSSPVVVPDTQSVGAETSTDNPQSVPQTRQASVDQGQKMPSDRGTKSAPGEDIPRDQNQDIGPAPLRSGEKTASTGTGERLSIDNIRRGWPKVLSRVSSARRYVWMILNQYATVTDLRGEVLWVTFSDPGARDNFNHAAGEEHLAQAIQAELGTDVHVRARLESEPIPADGTAILSLAKSGPATPEHGGEVQNQPRPPRIPSPGQSDGVRQEHSGQVSPASSGAADQPSSEVPLRRVRLDEPEPEEPGPPDVAGMSRDDHPGVDDAQELVQDSSAESSAHHQPSLREPDNGDSSIESVGETGKEHAETTAGADDPAGVHRKESAPPVPQPRPQSNAVAPPEEPDAPSEDDIVVENAADQAEELVMELFEAELVKEEPTKPPRRGKN